MGVSFKDRLKKAFPVFKEMFSRTKPMVMQQLVAGAAAGKIAVSKIKKGDQIVGVIESATSTAILTDRTDEFVVEVGDDGYIDNTGGTDTTSDSLLVTWLSWGN